MTESEIKELIEIRNLNVRMMSRYLPAPWIAIHSPEFDLIMKQQVLLDRMLGRYDEEPELIEIVLIKP